MSTHRSSSAWLQSTPLLLPICSAWGSEFAYHDRGHHVAVPSPCVDVWWTAEFVWYWNRDVSSLLAVAQHSVDAVQHEGSVHGAPGVVSIDLVVRSCSCSLVDEFDPDSLRLVVRSRVTQGPQFLPPVLQPIEEDLHWRLVVVCSVSAPVVPEVFRLEDGNRVDKIDFEGAIFTNNGSFLV